MDGEQLDRFNREGYVVLEDVLHPRDLDALHEEYHEILDRLAPRLVASERLTQDYGNLEFGQRYVEMIGEVEEMYDVYQSLDISVPLREGLSPNAEMSTGPAVFSVLTHPQLLDIVEAIVGPEILVNPTQHTRIKPPARRLPEIVTDTIIARTTWHQDFAFLEPEVYETDMLTVWVAVTDATSENGCLLVIPGSHSRGLSLHCPGKEYPGELYIPDELIDLDKAVPLEVGAGGLVLLRGFTEHASGDNHSDDIRWSFDFRYQPADQPTGCPFFLTFLARSVEDPDSAISDQREWAAMWHEARDRVASGQVQIPSRNLFGENSSHRLCT